MVYIRYINTASNNFAIVNHNDVFIDSIDEYKKVPGLIECDDLIAPVISVLNQKGYRTLFCCQGHFALDEYDFDEDKNKLQLDHINKIDSYPYIMFDRVYPELKKKGALPQDWEVKYCPVDQEVYRQRDKEGKSVELYRKIPGVKCRNVIRLTTYCNGFIKGLDKQYKDPKERYCLFNIFIAIQMHKLYSSVLLLPEVKINNK